MKLGTLDIKKAYFGSIELTDSNAFLGEIQLIPSSPVEWQGLKITVTASASNNLNISRYSSDNSKPADIKYSMDRGNTWSTLPSSTNTPIPLSEGDEVWLKGNNPTGLGYNNTSEYYFNAIKLGGSNTDKVTISGKIMSLIDDGVCGDTIPSCNGAFRKLFCPNTNTNVEITLDNLIFPNNTRPYCYEYMFYRCNNRTISLSTGTGYPTVSLPATISSAYCYRSMFYGNSDSSDLLTRGPFIWLRDTTSTDCMRDMFAHCKNLGIVYLRLQSSDSFSNAYSWLYDVKKSGSIIVPEFSSNYKYSFTVGDSGMPSGWYLQASKWDN